MTKTIFGSRIIVDYDFFNEIKLNTDILLKFMRININSLQYKKNHILISEGIYKKILKENPNFRKSTDIIKAAIRPINEPEIFESEKDEVTRNILYAIYLSHLQPYKTIIFTSNGKIEEYEKNKHYKNMRAVSAKAGKDAIQIINHFFEQAMDKEYY